MHIYEYKEKAHAEEIVRHVRHHVRRRLSLQRLIKQEQLREIMLSLKWNPHVYLGRRSLVYVIPLLMLVLGYFIVYFISNSESWGICAGFILMAAAYVVAAKIAKKNTNKYSLRVEKVINK